MNGSTSPRLALALCLLAWPAAGRAADGVWTQLAPAGGPPSARDGITGVYDPLRSRMIVYGGGGAWFDVWALGLSDTPTWTALAPSGTPPPGRAYYAAIYDWRRDRELVFGGNSSGAIRLNDLWELSFSGGPTWTQIFPAGSAPEPRAAHSAIFDTERDRMIVFGGVTTSSLLNDVWQLDLSGTPMWTQIAPSGTPPAGRSYHSAVYDSVGDRMLIFGGTGRNDLWALSLSGAPVWTEIVPSGSPPHGRFGHAACFDPGRDRMVVWGGAYPGFPSYVVFDDVWQLDLSGAPLWTQLAPAGPIPPGRFNDAAVYDPGHGRMVVFGGEGANTSFLNDSWALTWGMPPADVHDPPAPDMRLASPWPNPFRESLRVSFELSRKEDARLSVYDLHGRRVARIVAGRLDAGLHVHAWRAIDDRGHRLASGVYFVCLETAAGRQAQRVVLLP